LHWTIYTAKDSRHAAQRISNDEERIVAQSSERDEAVLRAASAAAITAASIELERLLTAGAD
jgi:hypothetical protein